MIDYLKGVHKDAGIKYKNHKDILITPLFTESFCKELCNIGDELKNKFNYWHQSNVAKDSTLYFNIMRSRYFAGEKFFEDFTIHYSQTISKMIILKVVCLNFQDKNLIIKKYQWDML